MEIEILKIINRKKSFSIPTWLRQKAESSRMRDNSEEKTQIGDGIEKMVPYDTTVDGTAIDRTTILDHNGTVEPTVNPPSKSPQDFLILDPTKDVDKKQSTTIRQTIS